MGGGRLDGYFGEQACQWASRSALKDFTEDAFTISAGSLVQNGTARMVIANWRRRVQHLCWWNLKAWPRSPLRVGCVKVDPMMNFRRPWVILNMNTKPPRICRCVRENTRSCWRAASYRTRRSPFTNFRSSFCTFSNAFVSG